MTTATTEPEDAEDTPPPGTDGTPATRTPKTWKDLLDISYEFNSHVNASYKHIHDALNDIYANTLNRTDLETLFTNAGFTTFKTQSSDGVNAVLLLTAIIHTPITAIADPGSTNTDRNCEILETCSLSWVDQTLERHNIV